MILNKIEKYINSKAYRNVIIFYLIFVFFVIIFSINIFSPYHSFTNNISDSMSPSIDRGSITIAKSFSKYDVGDIIAYYSLVDGKEEIVTHRVTSIGGNVYTTKGDANKVTDREIVRPRLVIGKIILIIPYLGYVITFAKSLVGTWLCIILPAIFIVASEFTRIIFELERQEKKDIAC